MMPEMSYIYQRPPDPITLDVYPHRSEPSRFVMYDCESPKSPISENVFECWQNSSEIGLSMSGSDFAYELWVHHYKEPASVLLDGEALPKIETRCCYESAQEGWYFGPGCFYGSDTTKTLNIKLPQSSRPRLIQIEK
jgi:hypothetical protein